MKSFVMSLLPIVIGVIVGLIVYNMFIAGSSWFGNFEPSNYDAVNGEVVENGMRVAA